MALASCSEGDNQENLAKNTAKETVIKVDSSSLKKDENKVQLINSFEDPININKLKQSSFLETTSGVLRKSESKIFCKPEIDGFFRFYYLIDKTNGVNSVFGKLKVFVPDAPNNWRADFEDEHFSEIELESGRIKLWEKIGVGSSLNELSEFIGENTQNIVDSVLTAEMGKYSLRALINKDTIKELSVGKYCK